ncbi:MAG: discoidin domain-containing protein [Phycisphaerales bacterium]|nr:MAG: discoidin domain-containing protein [Phycisphaerales bacterium]
MCKKLICSILLVLGLAIVGTAQADIMTGLKGLWEFDDAENLTTATLGNDLILNGSGQSAVSGISGADGAVAVESGTYYQCAHGVAANGGSTTYVNEFTLLFDVMYPEESVGKWRAFYQTGYETYNDSDYFINPGDESWGVAALGYTNSDTVGQWQSTHSTWYRAVLTVNLDDDPAAAFHDLYINGQLKGKHNTGNLDLDGRFSLYPADYANPYVVFSGDNNGEDALMYFSNIAIWERPLTAQEIAALGGPGDPIQPLDPALASNPSPADGAADVCTDVILRWTPGAYAPPANGHRVFFSENFDDVNDGAAAADRGPTSQPEFDTAELPFALDYVTTYYWRIDEANGVSGWDEGPVWQFATGPFAYALGPANITVTASSSEPGKGPENTINESGLDGDLHSNNTSHMWLSESSDTAAWIRYEFDKTYKLHEMWVWNFNGEGLLTLHGLKGVTIEYSTDGSTWTELAGVGEIPKAPGTDGYAHGAAVAFGGVAARYVKITVNSNHSAGLVDQHGLSEVRFLYLPVQAKMPSPEDQATAVPIDVVLSWRAGSEAASHELYFGPDEQGVSDGSGGPLVSLPASKGCDASYNISSLNLDTTYYWKIVEVNNAAEPNAWQSDVWSFTTADSLVVDDMDSYGDNDAVGQPGSRIWYTWRDGEGWTEPAPPYAGNGTGSVVDLSAGTSVAGAALAYYYDNDGTNFLGTAGKKYYSEATAAIADLPIGADWTRGGARALSVQFYGDPANVAGTTEQMYLKLNGVKIPYDGEMTDLQEAQWHEWLIDLASFGVDLHGVTNISIGFGNDTNPTVPGGSGVVIFDELRLYGSMCIPARRSAGFAKVDYVPDCVINAGEVAVMADKWLLAAAAPGAGNLVGWWKFDGNAQDSSDSGVHGTIMGDAAWVTGMVDSALELGGRTHVVLGSASNLNFGESTDFTVALWVKTVGWESDASIISNKDWDSGGNTGWVIAGQGGGSGSWQWNYSGATGGRRDYDPPGPILSDGEWHHLCVAHDRDAYARFYFDGEYQGRVNISGSTGTIDSGNPTVIAQDGTEMYDGWFVGAIDDVRIYNTVLADDQVWFLSGIRSDLNEDNKVDFKDFAGLGEQWLIEDMWP